MYRLSTGLENHAVNVLGSSTPTCSHGVGALSAVPPVYAGALASGSVHQLVPHASCVVAPNHPVTATDIWMLSLDDRTDVQTSPDTPTPSPGRLRRDRRCRQ